MIKKTTLALLMVALSGCSYIHPYHAPVQQGNIIETNTVSQLRVGMTREQVISLMGTPVSRNLFNDNQLAYFYTLKPNNGPSVYKRVIVTLQNNRVVNIEKYLTTSS